LPLPRGASLGELALFTALDGSPGGCPLFGLIAPSEGILL
jgi:hypothetical protein